MADLSTLSQIINVRDPSRQGLLVAFDSLGTALPPAPVRNDGLGLSLRFVVPGTTRPWDDFDVETARAAGGIRAAIGEFDKRPTAGSFEIGFGELTSGVLVTGKRYRIVSYLGADSFTNVGAASNATGVIFTASGTTPTTWVSGTILTEILLTDATFDGTAAALAALLNAMDSISDAGGVTVTKSAAGPIYRVTFDDAGARDFLVSEGNSLVPQSTVRISRAITGDADTRDVQRIELRQAPYCYQDTWTALAITPVAIATSIAGDATHNEVQVITLGAGCYGGTYSLTLTLPNVVTVSGGPGTTAASFTLSATATASEIEQILLTHPEAVGIFSDANSNNNLRVTGDTGGPFSIEFINNLGNRNIAAGTVADVNLLLPKIVTGELELNRDGIAQKFEDEGTDTIDLLYEIELQFPGQKPATVLQVPVTIGKDVIDLESLLPAPTASYPLPGSIVVGYPAITGLTGGGTTKLDGLPTAGRVCPPFLLISAPGAARLWEFVAGTDAEDGVGIVRPDDFHATTNAYVYKAVL